MKNKFRIVATCLGLLLLCWFALLGFSYYRLTSIEQKCMPDFQTLAATHKREVSLQPFGYSGWVFHILPYWTITYRQTPITDIHYIDPSITVNVFGTLVDASGKEVRMAAGIY